MVLDWSVPVCLLEKDGKTLKHLPFTFVSEDAVSMLSGSLMVQRDHLLVFSDFLKRLELSICVEKCNFCTNIDEILSNTISNYDFETHPTKIQAYLGGIAPNDRRTTRGFLSGSVLPPLHEKRIFNLCSVCCPEFEKGYSCTQRVQKRNQPSRHSFMLSHMLLSGC